MTIVGCDFHPSWQQIAVLDGETGEITERRLMNGNGEAERFYQALSAPSLIGIEACGNSQWLIDLWQRLGHEVWIGDAAQIRASYVRKQKTDRRSVSGDVCHDLAWVNIGLGNEDEALAWLEKEYQRHDNDGLTELKVEPIFDPLRSDPRFQDLLRRMKFPFVGTSRT